MNPSMQPLNIQLNLLPILSDLANTKQLLIWMP